METVLEWFGEEDVAVGEGEHAMLRLRHAGALARTDCHYCNATDTNDIFDLLFLCDC